MELSLQTAQSACYRRAWTQTVRREESFETVVPDTLPDIGEVLDAAGLLLIRSKEVSTGALEVTATVAVHVVYLPEGGGARPFCFEVSVPVGLEIHDERLETESICTVELQLLSQDCRVVNPRKVVLRADVHAFLQVFASQQIELCQAIQAPPPGVYAKTDTVTVTPCVTVREKTFVVGEELALPELDAPCAQILGNRVRLSVTDCRSAGNKLVFKGRVLVDLSYLSTEDTLCQVPLSCEYSQILDIDGEVVQTELLFTPTGAYFSLPESGDGRVLSMELHVLVQGCCYGRWDLSYISDLYSNVHPVTVQRQAVELCCDRREIPLRASVRQSLDIPGNVQEVRSYEVTPLPGEVSAGALHLPIQLSARFLMTDGTLHAVHRRLECSTPLECGEDDEIEGIHAQVAEISVSPGATGLDVYAALEATIAVSKRASLQAVAAVSFEEGETLDLSALPSLVILPVTQTQSLWELARDNHSSVEAIERLNAPREDVAPRYLLIPRLR